MPADPIIVEAIDAALVRAVSRETARAERAEAAIAAVRALPESPDGNVVIPAAAEEWQNGWRWGWRYAIQATKRALCVDPCGYPNCWHPENGCARFAALDVQLPAEEGSEEATRYRWRVQFVMRCNDGSEDLMGRHDFEGNEEAAREAFAGWVAEDRVSEYWRIEIRRQRTSDWETVEDTGYATAALDSTHPDTPAPGRAGRFETLLGTEHEQFDQRGELLRSVVEYMDAPSGTVSAPAPGRSGEDTRCRVRYQRAGVPDPGDRIVKCHLGAGHSGEHEEADTGVTWPQTITDHAFEPYGWDPNRCGFVNGDDEMCGAARFDHQAITEEQL